MRDAPTSAATVVDLGDGLSAGFCTFSVRKAELKLNTIRGQHHTWQHHTCDNEVSVLTLYLNLSYKI